MDAITAVRITALSNALRALPSRERETLLDLLSSLPSDDGPVDMLRMLLSESSPISTDEEAAPQVVPPRHPDNTQTKDTSSAQDKSDASEQNPAGQDISGSRKPSKIYDFLVLEAIKQGIGLFGMVGQDAVFDVANAFDPLTKKRSLSSQLSRWRTEKGWVEWRETYDMKLSPDGELRRQMLLKATLAASAEDRVKTAFKKAWDKEVTLSGQ